MKLGIIAEFPAETLIVGKLLSAKLKAEAIEIFNPTENSYFSMKKMFQDLGLNVHIQYTPDGRSLTKALLASKCDHIHVATNLKFALASVLRTATHLNDSKITILGNELTVNDNADLIVDKLTSKITNTQELVKACDLETCRSYSTAFRTRHLNFLLKTVSNLCDTTPEILPESIIWEYKNRIFWLGVSYSTTTTAVALYTYAKHKQSLTQLAGKLGAVALINTAADCQTLTAAVQTLDTESFDRLWHTSTLENWVNGDTFSLEKWIKEVVSRPLSVPSTPKRLRF